MKRTAPATAALLACSVLAPAATSSAAGTPAPQQVTGTVQTVIREQPPGLHHDGGDRTSTVLRVGTRVVPLTDGSLPDAESGDRVTAALVPAAEGASHVLAARTLAAAPKAAVSTTQSVYLAMVLPKGFTKPASATTAEQMVAKASAYWSSQTGGQVKFAVAQVLKDPITSKYSCGQTEQMWAEATSKLPASLGPDHHLVVVAPPGAYTSGCDYGLGTIGEGVHTSDSAVFVSDLNPSLFAHELGHNLGLYHSNSLRCRTSQDSTYLGAWPAACHQEEYDDLFDVMGYSGTGYGEGSLNGVQLDDLHLLPTALRRITAAGTVKVRLAPLSTTTAGRAVRVTDSTGVSYVVQYRTRSGRDAAAAALPDKPSYGVEVLRADPTVPGGGGSDVLDATPSTRVDDYSPHRPRRHPLHRGVQAPARPRHLRRRRRRLRHHLQRHDAAGRSPLTGHHLDAHQGVVRRRPHRGDEGHRPVRPAPVGLVRGPGEAAAGHDDLEAGRDPADHRHGYGVLPVRQRPLRQLPLGQRGHAFRGSAVLLVRRRQHDHVAHPELRDDLGAARPVGRSVRAGQPRLGPGRRGLPPVPQGRHDGLGDRAARHRPLQRDQRLAEASPQGHL